MSLLADVERVLIGSGPSLTSPRVMRAMTAPLREALESVWSCVART